MPNGEHPGEVVVEIPSVDQSLHELKSREDATRAVLHKILEASRESGNPNKLSVTGADASNLILQSILNQMVIMGALQGIIGRDRDVEDL